MPQKLHIDGVHEVRGVYANQQLLPLLTDMVGREVIVDTRDGLRYEGIFAACSPQFGVGLKYAHELPSPDEMKSSTDDHKKLLPHKDDVIEKLQFERDDVVYITAVMREEKRIEGFATDREYADRSGAATEADSELEAWEADDEIDDTFVLADDQQDGWSVEQMFQANNVLGVKSTFDENMVQYATADVQGDSEDLKRAERIAQEINSNQASKVRAQLENDDEERDLDKETLDFQVQQSNRRTSGVGRGSYSGNNRERGGGNVNRIPPGGRRSEGMLGAGRGRGGLYGSGGCSSRSFTNSSLSHGIRAPNAVTSGSASRYGTSAGVTERPSAQEVHVQFGQWARRNEGGSSTSVVAASADSMRGGARRSDQMVGNTGNASSTRVYESSQRMSHHEAQPPRAGEENKNSHHSGSPHGLGTSLSGSISRQQTSKQTERVRNLREFHQNFNSAYQPSHSTHSSTDDDQRASSAQTVSSTVAAPRPVNNAWNKGPPASIRAPSSSQVIQHPGASATKDVDISSGPSPSDQRLQPITRTRGPVQSSVVPGRSIAETTPPTEAAPSTAESRLSRPATTTAALETASPPVIHAATSATAAPDPQPAPASGTPREVHQTQLSAAASSSSIAPTDPTPSSAAQNDTTSAPPTTAVTTTTVTSGEGKTFTWNPNAPSFTPRGYTLVSVRSCEQQQNFRTTVHNVRTPPAAPQPLMSTHVAAPGQMQALTLTNPQGLSVQNVQSISHAGPPQMFPYAHTNAYGTAMPVYYNSPVVQTTPNGATATAAANVTGGPIVANTTGLPISRQGQMVGQTASAARRNQQQQLVQSVAGLYIPGAGQPYAQQLVSQYQMPYFTPYPPQLSIGGSANLPPPPIPPPTTNTVITAPPPYQLIQAQTQQQVTGYPRQFYQGDQSVNYMVSRYQPHAVVDYNVTAGTTQQISQQQSQHASSATSSNGTGSNGHNSQPATPGPVISPAQVQQQQPSQYPQSGTPQSQHTMLLQLSHGTAPPSAQPHMYVQSQFPFIAPGQPSLYYNPQQVFVHPSVAAAAHVPFSQAHQTHGQPSTVEHYQGAAAEQGGIPQGQIPGMISHQAYVGGGGDQFYGQYVHAQQQQTVYQQQTGSVRQNTINSGNSGPPHQQQPFQPGGVQSNPTQPSNSSEITERETTRLEGIELIRRD